MQDYEGLAQLRNGWAIKKVKSMVVRMVYLYIRRRSILDQRPEVAADAKGALKHLSKKYDTDNRRKAQASSDLLFLSWAYIMRGDGKLQKALHESECLTGEEIQAVLKQFDNIFTKITKTDIATLAKTFRENLRAHVMGLVASKKTQKV